MYRNHLTIVVFLLIVTAPALGVSGEELPEIIQPVPGSVLSCSDWTFKWSANETPVLDWWLYLSTLGNGNDVFDSGYLGTQTEVTIEDVPIDGDPVWAILFYRTPQSGSTWLSRTFEYRAGRFLECAPDLVGPTDLEFLSGMTRFAWRSNGAPVVQWWLYVGSEPGYNDLYDSQRLDAGTTEVFVDLGLQLQDRVHVTLFFRYRDLTSPVGAWYWRSF